MFRIILISIFFSALQANAKHLQMSLQKAMDLKLVSAKATSLGGYQGFCMQMEVKNLSRDSLIVLVESGRRLKAMDSNDQDILIVKEVRLLLKKDEAKSCQVKGYCCQANNRAPSVNARYSINQLADSSLVRVARYLSLNAFDKDAEQAAVWAVSDNKPAANIAARCDSLVLPLRSFVAGLKGERLPWYSVVSGTYVYANGVISVFPLLLKGKLQYANDKDSYISLTVLNEKGLPVCLLKDQWLKAAGLADYHVSLDVKGMAKGRYTIALSASGRQLAKAEFEL